MRKAAKSYKEAIDNAIDIDAESPLRGRENLVYEIERHTRIFLAQKFSVLMMQSNDIQQTVIKEFFENLFKKPEIK